MKRLFLLIMCLAASVVGLRAQINNNTDNGQFTDGSEFSANGYQRNRNFGRSDSIQSQHKDIPRGLKVWTVDNRFGDRRAAVPDTLSYMFMNSIFTTGLHGEYNTLGNVGSPRINRILDEREGSVRVRFSRPLRLLHRTAR